MYYINGYLAGASRGRITCTTTLCRVLFHEFGINPSPDDLAVALVELGFNFRSVGPELIKRTTTGGRRGIGVPRAPNSSPSWPFRSGSSTPGIEKRAKTPKSPPTGISKVAEVTKPRKQTKIGSNTGNIDPLPNKGIVDAKLRVPVVKEKKVAQSKGVMAGTKVKAVKGNRTPAVKEKVAQSKEVVAGMRAKEMKSNRTPTTKGERVAKNKEVVAGTSTKEVKAVVSSGQVQNKVVSRLQGRTVTGDTRGKIVYVKIESGDEATSMASASSKAKPAEPPAPGLVHKARSGPAGPAAPSGVAGRVGIGSTGEGGGPSGGTMTAEQRRWLLKHGSESMGLTDEMHWKARTGEFNQIFSTAHNTQMLRKIWWLLKFAQTRSAPAKPLIDQAEKFTPGMESALVELATKNKQRDDEINWLRLRQKFNRTFKVDYDIPVLKQVYERILRKKEMGS